jgi:Rod binding domain-containing protein
MKASETHMIGNAAAGQAAYPLGALPSGRSSQNPASFLAALNSAMGDQSPGRDDLTAAAQKVVSQTFFGNILKQMRESPFRSELFDGGRGGQAFASLYDQHMADHMARGVGKKLVNSIVRRYRRPGDKGDPKTQSKDVIHHVAPGLRA